MDLRSLEVLFLATQPTPGPGTRTCGPCLLASAEWTGVHTACNSSAVQRPVEGWPATGPQVPIGTYSYLQGCLPALGGAGGSIPTGSSPAHGGWPPVLHSEVR